MFGLFKKKTEVEKLQENYKALLEKAHKVSHSNRTESDKLMAEAEEIAKKIDSLKSK
ncbi:Lacal_2735 family protein [Belliella sp. R4-6]|uniref:Lacal_2735 family protein n=1 Tax=Belliella alkalica TaxID=1730871 RepID=A0ABS9VGH4_9BACT|nr:Lacal_2735 family protein [Belliella alkalica]MCH7415550.1 Lacal_2735 family protein [Belliella alkalica]